MNFPFFIARKIHNGGDGNKQVSKPAINIATIGVAVGLAVMMITVAVVLGFKSSIRDKVVGFGSHITIANYLTFETSDQHPIQITDAFQKTICQTEGITHSQRFALKQGILKTDNDFLGIMLKGVANDFDTTFIANNIIDGSLPDFANGASKQQLVVSQTIAEKLHLKVGEKIFAYFVDNTGIRTRRFTIKGIYETNLKQYDSQICFTNLSTVQRLNGWETDQFSGLELQVKDFNNLETIGQRVLRKVKNKTDQYDQTYSSETITEQNPQIFSWLNLMDLNVWIILGLMVSVASVTMISGLLIIILERTQMIGLLKALGSRNRQIRSVFLWFSVFIIGRGLLIGNLFGLLFIGLQHQFGLVQLDPQIYYVDTVPVSFNLPIIIGLNLFTLFICLAVLLLPSLFISQIHPAKSMHYE